MLTGVDKKEKKMLKSRQWSGDTRWFEIADNGNLM